jgi:hypothetical protein
VSERFHSVLEKSVVGADTRQPTRLAGGGSTA